MPLSDEQKAEIAQAILLGTEFTELWCDSEGNLDPTDPGLTVRLIGTTADGRLLARDTQYYTDNDLPLKYVIRSTGVNHGRYGREYGDWCIVVGDTRWYVIDD